MDHVLPEPPLRIYSKTIEAACYNSSRLALLRLECPLRITLQQHRGLEVILDDAMWICVDSYADDRLIMAWREFEVAGRLHLHHPVACKLWIYHGCASLVMGSVLDDLEATVRTLMAG
ncbi:hypothetical protein [Nitrosomonas halophila]|uniref:Uncharacterized protein n=1 Tax=Nitrosomonas halophila TaxID=44576 RepID=A0A1H3PYY1_9PROT|nr:hypothetical protein [Nitrosomonas halophila]SDZ06005.1 hypothetical protein SAMN05421881_11191 [Nitrosomonas halophila]